MNEGKERVTFERDIEEVKDISNTLHGVDTRVTAIETKLNLFGWLFGLFAVPVFSVLLGLGAMVYDLKISMSYIEGVINERGGIHRSAGAISEGSSRIAYDSEAKG